MIKEIMEKIERFLNSPPTKDDYQFFDELEFFAFENYESFAKENKEIADKIDDDIIEVCAWVEHMEDCTEHRKKLKKVYEELKQLMGQG